jgi:hypothetical protein
MTNDIYNRWVDALFISLDGCFKFKRKARHIDDPDISSGSFYFVRTAPFQHHMVNSPADRNVVSSVCLVTSFLADLPYRKATARQHIVLYLKH